jgi:NADH-quinone oxidoreductase subunit H
MLKIMFKEDWTPKFADKLTFRLAPAVAMATAVLSSWLFLLAHLWVLQT